MIKETLKRFLDNRPYSIPFFILLCLNMTGWAAILFFIYLANHDL